jgi:hypothetical protein
MGRQEAVALGFLASIAYVTAGVLKLGTDRPFGLLLAAVGAYGLVVLTVYRKRIVA